ncbi:MAG: phosphatase PAP2 family protein, partial [Thermoanaerobaculia bacterium]
MDKRQKEGLGQLNFSYLFLIFLIPSLILKSEEIEEKKCNFLCKSLFSLAFSLALDEKVREISQKKELGIREEISKYFEPLGRRSTGFYLSSSLFIFSIFKKDSKVEKLAFELFEINLLSDFSVNFLQKGFGRERPKESRGDPYNFFKGGNSFPSSHSLHLWALAYTLSQYYPEYRKIIFVFPVLTSLERILEDHHFLSDVVSGAIFGMVLSKFVFKLNQKYSNFLFYPVINKDKKAIALKIYL